MVLEMTVQPLSGPLEAAVRLLVITCTCYPEAYALDDLATLDHMLIHSADFGGPPSLHPASPARESELSVKRDLVGQGLRLLLRTGLVRMTFDGLSISYSASEDGPGFLSLLTTSYASSLVERAEWVCSVGPVGEARPDEQLRRALTRIVTADGPSWIETEGAEDS